VLQNSQSLFLRDRASDKEACQILDPCDNYISMKIEKGANIAVVVNRSWANLWGVRVFLRQNETPEREVRGDDSHLVFAKLLDSEDPNGLWVELNTERQKKDPTVKLASFFIPWSQVLTIVVTEEFSPAIREEIRKIGFAG